MSRLSPARARVLRLLLLVLAGSAGLPLVRSHASAQTVDELVAEKERAYRAARDAYQAALSAREVVAGQFTTALTALERARREGDEDALERAMSEAYARGLPLRTQDQRVRETARRLEEARDELVEILTVRLEGLIEEMDAAGSSAERARLDVLFRDFSNRVRELEAEAQGGYTVDLVVLPEINFDPRDSPDDLQAKAQLLERKAAVADTVLQSIDRDIEQLQNRLRLQRQRRDFIAGTRRFDDTRLPVVTPQPGRARGEGGPVAAGDSTSVDGGELTLEQRIEDLRNTRIQVEQFRDQARIRARQFRRGIGPVTGGGT